MKSRRKHTQTYVISGSKFTRGVTLIELLIATAIGIILSVLAINYFSLNVKTRDANSAYATLKDNGAVSLYFMTFFGRSAGIQTIPIYGDVSILNGECSKVMDYCTFDSKIGSDRLAIRKFFPVHTQACNGQIAYEKEDFIDIFSIETNDNYSALVCQSYSLTDQEWLRGSSRKRVLQIGVEDFQVQFYQPDTTQPVNAELVTDWGRVQGVEVAFLANSEVPAFTQKSNKRFKLLDADIKSFNDRKARQIFQTTIAFNNQFLEEITP